MQRLRSVLVAVVLFTALSAILSRSATAQEKSAKVVKYARFQVGKKISYGIVEGNLIHALDGDLFGKWKRSGSTHKLSEVQLLVPCQPTQVFAMAGNYRSHLTKGNVVTTITTKTTITTNPESKKTTVDSSTDVDERRPGVVPKKFQIIQPFFKSPACLIAQGESIILPKGSKEVHYEAEMVIVIGKRAENVSLKDAKDYVLGVTCGNDVSARDWQKNDVQWWRAKGSKTFGPCGPFIVSGLNYDQLQMKLRLNGKTLQDENTKMLIHNVSKTVSELSKYVVLHPGDLIFSGTPGKTSAMKAGDVVEVEIEGVGILKNNVIAEK